MVPSSLIQTESRAIPFLTGSVNAGEEIHPLSHARIYSLLVLVTLIFHTNKRPSLPD